MNNQELQSRFESLEYLLQMGPENFVDYDFADEAQAEVDLILQSLSEMNEYEEPQAYNGLFQDLVSSLESLESHLQ